MHWRAVDAAVKRSQERQHEPPLTGLGADLAQIEDAAFGHAGDRLADQRAGVLGQGKVAVRPAENRNVEPGRGFAVRLEPQAPPDAQRVNDNRTRLGGQ